MLLEHTLLTPGEIAESGGVYAGWPARRLKDETYTQRQSLVEHLSNLKLGFWALPESQECEWGVGNCRIIDASSNWGAQFFLDWPEPHSRRHYISCYSISSPLVGLFPPLELRIDLSNQ